MEKDAILLSVRWRSALAYLDSTVELSKALGRHFAYYRMLLMLVRNSGVTFQLRMFLEEKNDNLSRVIHTGKAWTAQKLEMTRKLQARTIRIEAQSFLALWNVFRRFLLNFPQISTPLKRRLCKDEPKGFQ